MRIFVAGATGVLGTRVVPLLVSAGHDVTAVGRTPDKRALLERFGARAVAVDLFDPSAVHRVVVGHDTIVNLATAVPSPVWRSLLPGAWHEMDRVRRHVSANLVEGAIASGTAKRVIQESFAPIYPDSGDRKAGSPSWHSTMPRPPWSPRSAFPAGSTTSSNESRCGDASSPRDSRDCSA